MGKVYDYLDIYNKLWDMGEFLAHKDRKKKDKLHQWALNEDRRKALYKTPNITTLEY